MIYYIHCDGSCYNHPDYNTVGYAAVLSEVIDPLMIEVMKTRTGWQASGTNNIAEWLAVIAGIELMVTHHAERGSSGTFDEYRIYTDSNLIVGQANGKFRVREPKLKTYYKMYKNAVSYAKDIDFAINWVSRKQNKAADIYSKLINPYFKDKLTNELRQGNKKCPQISPNMHPEDIRDFQGSHDHKGKPKGRSGRSFRFA